MWNGAIKGLIDLDKDLFIKRFDLHSIEDEEFKLLLQKGLLNENTFHQSKNEIENTHQQNSTIGKNKKERNKLDELLKLEEILINHQSNEIQKKTQKSKESKTLSLKDLLTKDDTKIDKRQKTSLLKELFINDIITHSQIIDLVKKGKIDQRLYIEINSDPKVNRIKRSQNI